MKSLKRRFAGLALSVLTGISFGFGRANADELNAYVEKPEMGVVDKAWDYSKYLAGVGVGGALWMGSHEFAHTVVGNATGVKTEYDPMKNPREVRYGGKGNAVTSGAGLLTQNLISYAILNSKNTNLRKDPIKAGYLIGSLVSNLSYAFLDNKNNETSDVNQLENFTGVPSDVYRAAVVASSIYIAKKAWDNIRDGPSKNLENKFDAHFGEDGTVGVKYDVGNSYMSAGVNAERKSVEVGFTIPLGKK